MNHQHRHLPPLNAVRAFEAAARLGSFKNAAAELNVTHGAISQHIRLLEQWLGTPALFRRSVRRVALTPAGAALLAEVGPALDRIADAVQQHRAKRSDTTEAVLHVNALATFSMRWLLPRMSRFRDEHPEIEVRLTTSNDPIDALPETYDVVIRGGPDTYHGFSSRFVVSERRLPVCSPTLLRQLPLDEVQDLSRHTLLNVTSMPRLWRDWLAAAGEPGLRPAGALTFDHFYLTIQAAIDGLGIAMGPTALVSDDLAATRLIAPFPEISLPARPYFAYMPAANSNNSHSVVFCNWLADQGERSERRDASNSCEVTD
ncbi:Transcriptional regulatory protein [Bradyrhizobium sp. STM 3843]|uniref:LysR substrate-binding domain-containing protein n=1 Tax=Bradyrhizobium sp. STM 3843 TaxID=551947 RepID=UPI000240328C|nr:LysR substrate-binding domain-containing protein [Bradyrhizobium sp. STM 3843]CCE10710.1 Transcriptional regulatory protein [Bradyrhizobium sp. STM 3843]